MHTQNGKEESNRDRVIFVTWSQTTCVHKSGHKLRAPPKLQKYLHDNCKYDNVSSECVLQKKWIQCTQTTDSSGCMKNVLLLIVNVLHLYMNFNIPLWLWS